MFGRQHDLYSGSCPQGVPRLMLGPGEALVLTP